MSLGILRPRLRQDSDPPGHRPRIVGAFALGQNLFSQPLRALGGVLITSENPQMGISQQSSVVILGANLANLQVFFPCFCHQISVSFFTKCSLKLIPGISGISNDMPHKSQDGHGWTEHVSGSETSHGSHDVDLWPADCRLATGSATEQIHRYNSFNHQLSATIRQSSESESIKDPRKNI